MVYLRGTIKTKYAHNFYMCCLLSLKIYFPVSNIGFRVLKYVNYLRGNGHIKDKNNYFLVALLNILDKRNNPYWWGWKTIFLFKCKATSEKFLPIIIPSSILVEWGKSTELIRNNYRVHIILDHEVFQLSLFRFLFHYFHIHP